MKEKNNHNKGEMGLGTIFVLMIVALFVIWVLTNGRERGETEAPFIKTYVE